MERITLYEEIRLIERSESEVSTAWKGGHLLLFFLAFVFGSFCTFCFHMLMYLFDEKCVLFPKLLSLNSLRHNVIYEFIPDEQEKSDPLPVDFLSTQFIHKSACYLPTYVPLVSGIFGLVWTTMFLMCSSGSRALSGPQRPWRVILPVLVFSLAMSMICIYSSAITHYGLQDLCLKLGEITGSSSCSYTVNVATLAYERQIRGVYQATRLTITSAWLHTGCWVASTILAFVRILLAVDFRLVKIRAELIGDLDKILEEHEEQVHTVLPQQWHGSEGPTSSESQVLPYFRKEDNDKINEFGQLIDNGSDILFISEQPKNQSNLALLLEERNKSARLIAYESLPIEHRFIVDMVYDILDLLEYPLSSSSDTTSITSSTEAIARQFGQQTVSSQAQHVTSDLKHEVPTKTSIIKIAKDKISQPTEKPQPQIIELPLHSSDDEPTPGTSKWASTTSETVLNILPRTEQNIEENSFQSVSATSLVRERGTTITLQKANLKYDVEDAAIQTENMPSKKKQKVTIKESHDASDKELHSPSDSKKDKKNQTDPKEKQD